MANLNIKYQSKRVSCSTQNNDGEVSGILVYLMQEQSMHCQLKCSRGISKDHWHLSNSHSFKLKTFIIRLGRSAGTICGYQQTKMANLNIKYQSKRVSCSTQNNDGEVSGILVYLMQEQSMHCQLKCSRGISKDHWHFIKQSFI